METLIRKRSSTKGTLTRIQTAVDAFTLQNVTGSDLQVKMDKLAELKTKFESIQDDIELQCEENDLAQHTQERSEFEDKFETIKAKVKELLRQLGQDTIAASVPGRQKANLPKINLLNFEGNYADWTSYYDLFSALIDRDTTLPKVTKLHYLKMTVKGEPYRLISNLQTTDANYAEALNLLKNRYENKRMIIQEHVTAIFSAPAVTVESAVNLRKLLDTIQQNMRALAVLEQPTDKWDTLISHIICDKLDSDSRRQWELSLETADPPSLKQLTEFLEVRCRALEATPNLKATTKPTSSQSNTTSNKSSCKSSSSLLVNADQACILKCNESHAIYKCSKFHQMTIEERVEVAKKHNLCFNCLSANHSIIKCTSGPCKKCHKRHHTLLHKNSNRPNPELQNTAAVATNQATNQVVSEEAPRVLHNHGIPEKSSYVLLSTAIIQVEDSNHQFHKCRALLDGGSQANFITENLVNKLQLKKKPHTLEIGGIGSSTTRSKGFAIVNLSSSVTNFKMETEAIILPTITKDLPSCNIDASNWTHLKNLHLADPTFHVPGEIDMLLGAQIVSEILNGRKISARNKPTALSTELGWILSGKCDLLTAKTNSLLSTFHTISEDQQLRKFWEIEEVPTSSCWSTEEKAAEDHFDKTHVRNQDGTYTVQLPFKNEPPESFGNSSQRAISQFLQIEAQLERNPTRQQQYNDFMTEYLRLDHMELVPKEQVELPQDEVYYIPHHSVIRESSTTTKLRVVFNASAKSPSFQSLNDQLMVGPTVQPELMTLLMRFRLNKFAMTADIEKMYRQVRTAQEHQDFQRIVWRQSSSEPIQIYRLKTVTYGTASAPFLATRTLNQLAHDEERTYPQGSKTLREDFYVDDLLSGANTEAEALELQHQLTNLLHSGGFHLRKWSSNQESIVQAVPKEDRAVQESQQLIPSESVKTLGILWNPQSDQFSFTVPSKTHSQVTKRIILSEVSKLFDPFGWLSPVVLVGKLQIKELWTAGVKWDDELPSDLADAWNKFASELPVLNDLRIDRFVQSQPNCIYELHGFGDASEKAYGAVVYLRVVRPSGEVDISLLCSKTRVAPLQQISLPRLELCGAVILSRLLKWTENILNLPEVTTFAWTDSTVVLTWLAKTPRTWKTFVANRVSEIQETISPENWYHVASQENPADICSRGLNPSQFLQSSLWWKGPPWLCNVEPQSTSLLNRNDRLKEVDEERRATISLVSTHLDAPLLEGFSSLSRLVRVTAYCLRFVENLRKPRTARQTGFLTSTELKQALHHWIGLVQRKEFNVEISSLKKEIDCPSSSRLKALHPFLDSSSLLRVGGRLENARIKYDHRHPIILPTNHHLTKLIIDYEHKRNLHAGPSLLLSILHQQYWILRGRSAIRGQLFKCLKCFRERAKVATQLMGNLPTHRVEPARAFLHVGVDYAGPVMIKDRPGRGRIQQRKAYIVVFVCFSTRAIHLDLVTDASSSMFLAAFRRFVARRGRPAHVYSDCGSNFVGVQPELKELRAAVTSSEFQENVGSSLATENVQWHFNPPAAPHFGGLWEAGVKSTKQHLRRVIGNVILPYEDLLTLLLQVEACLNSRPLCPVSSDVDNYEALTPAHFLIGESLTSLPDPDLRQISTNRLSRWQLVQQMFQNFWKRWHREYLHRLQQRPKWTKTFDNIEVGDLVLMKEDGMDSLKWPLARVEQTYVGKDDLVRVVLLKTKTGQFKRPITKVCKLPLKE